jgi:hypothetical protein
MASKQSRTAYGYDGNGYKVGDRVELHPGFDLWMQGARFGEVTRITTTETHVRSDHSQVRKIIRSAHDRFQQTQG